MERKSIPRLLPVFFIALMGLMGLLLLALPRQGYSPMEKRVLARPPAITLAGGQFSRDIEAYLDDHFPLRAHWVGLDARRRFLSGTMVADSVWRLPGGALAEAPVSQAGGLMARNLDLLADFAQEAGLPLALMAVPSAGAVWGQQAYYPYPDEGILARLGESAPEGLRLIPLFEGFRKAEAPLYYRTDPHWNGAGAYAAYRQAAPFLGFEPLPASAFTITESPDFRGSAYARSGLWATPPDALQMWDSGQRVSLSLDGRPESHDSLFFREHLTAPDQYPVFLDGNHGLTDIQNLDKPEGPKLLVIKDSFGNSLVPLLVPHFSRITVLDLRAYRGSPLALAREGGYQQVLAVYSLRFLATDTNFAWLGMK